MKKKIISLLLAMAIVVSQFASISMAATNQSKSILGISMSEFSKKLPSMGFDEHGWFSYYGAALVEDKTAYFILQRESDEFCKAIKTCFNLLLPTEGNELYKIVSNEFEDRIYEMDGRTVKIENFDGNVSVEIYDNYKPQEESSSTYGNLEVGMSFSDFKKQLSKLGIKNNKYIENGKTMGTITATSASAQIIVQKKSTKFNAVLKKALKMLFPLSIDNQFVYNEIINGRYEYIGGGAGNRQIEIIKSGSKTIVNISKLDIGNIKIYPISNYIYTGKNIEPNLSMEHTYQAQGGIGVYFLKKGKDYTVEFKNNKYPGTVTAVIKGKGEFKGSKTVTFKIFPKQTTGVKGQSTSSSSIKLTWTKQPNVNGYEILRATSKLGNYERVAIVNNTASFTDKNLKGEKTYYYKVRSYKNIDKKKQYGSNSTIYSVKTKS